MSYVLAALIVLFLLAVHELSHALVGMRRGARVTEISLGLGPGFTYQHYRNEHHEHFTIKRPVGPRWSIRLILIGAFVTFREDDEQKTLWDFWTVAAGPVSSLLLGAVIGLAAFLIAPTPDDSQLDLIGPALVFVLSTPPGIALVLFQHPEGLSTVGGIISVVQHTADHFDSLHDTLQRAALLSASLGGFNLWPIPPMDGGRLMLIVRRKLLRRQSDSPPTSGESFAILSGSVVMLLLLSYLLMSDVLHLFGR